MYIHVYIYMYVYATEGDLEAGGGPGGPASKDQLGFRPRPGSQIVFFNCPDLYHNSPNSGDRRYTSMT